MVKKSTTDPNKQHPLFAPMRSVLDEVDKMLEMGFVEDVEKILGAVRRCEMMILSLSYYLLLHVRVLRRSCRQVWGW